LIIQLQQQTLDLQKDKLRQHICWTAGAKPKECGNWANNGTAAVYKMPIPTSAPTPAKAADGTK
jgi:hypothetical protein